MSLEAKEQFGDEVPYLYSVEGCMELCSVFESCVSFDVSSDPVETATCNLYVRDDSQRKVITLDTVRKIFASLYPDSVNDQSKSRSLSRRLSLSSSGFEPRHAGTGKCGPTRDSEYGLPISESTVQSLPARRLQKQEDTARRTTEVSVGGIVDIEMLEKKHTPEP
jgi:hypothetical protein